VFSDGFPNGGQVIESVNCGPRHPSL